MPLTKDEAAKLLKSMPGAVEAFEDAYHYHVLDPGLDTGSPFDISAKQVKDAIHEGQTDDSEPDEALTRRIVAELMLQSEYMDWDGKRLEISKPVLRNTPEGEDKLTVLAVRHPIGKAELIAVPAPVRPQLSGNLYVTDMEMEGGSYAALCGFYKAATRALSKKKRQTAYNMLRQGLDMLDLDPMTYAILGTNKNAMSHWLPQLIDACRNQSFFKIPKTRIVRIPLPMLQLTRLDYASLTKGTMAVVDRFCFDAFNLDEDKEYFVKTGTYSSKFDFRNAHVHGIKEVRELGEYLLFIQNQAVMMASPLSSPSIYGASTTNEWVVREYIRDPEDNPTIYKGLPLRTEYRVFIDCDTDEVLGIAPYWEPETMKKRFGGCDDANSPHQIHDYITYLAVEERLMARYEANKAAILRHVENILPGLDLPGQWSLDIMQSGDEFWIIDMALAGNSALNECVPPQKLKRASDITFISPGTKIENTLLENF